MFERLTDQAQQVVVHAQKEARGFNHDYIGTEHILLAILHASDTVAARALRSFGISLEPARQQVENVVGRREGSSGAHIPFSRRAKKTLELALREALQLQHNHIGTEHILLGIIREGEGTAVRVLRDLGVELSELRERVVQAGAAAGDEAIAEEVRVSIGAEVSSAVGARPLSGDEPRCSRCNAAAADNVRIRTVSAVSGSHEETSVMVRLVWCGVCGAVLGALPAFEI
jgi:ATP-dependent Clp protease ATP-binding subunit ClpC